MTKFSAPVFAPVTVGLVQINSGARAFLPYGAGLLQAYVQTHAKDPRRYQFLPILTGFEQLEQGLAALQSADIVGFSAYTWNIQRTLALAKAIKENKPECLIVFGGPEVPNHAHHFLKNAPFIDLCVHGEGEETFCQLLEYWPEKPWSEIDGLSYFDQTGVYQIMPSKARQKHLDAFPSPYLKGIFEPLMQAQPGVDWAILWETNRGCPFSCTFCDWGSATQSKLYAFSLERIFAELDWFAKNQIGYIFCCDANFGILPRDIEIAKYAARLRLSTGFPRALVVQNTKNITARAVEVQKILAASGLDTSVTLSLQSLDPQVLKAVKRSNISLQAYADLQKELMQANIKTYSDMILGLPEETYDSFVSGLVSVVEQGQYHDIKIFPAGLLVNAEMASPESREKFGLKTVKIPCVYVHSSIHSLTHQISEFQEIVIATHSLSEAEWVRAMAFGWCLHFLLYAPGVIRMAYFIFQTLQPFPLREIVEKILDLPQQDFPLLAGVGQFFLSHAQGIQAGGNEHCTGPASYYQEKWWSPFEYCLRALVYEQELDDFYQELKTFLGQNLTSAPPHPGLLANCLDYSKTFILLKHQQEIAPLHLAYNIWEVYQAALEGKILALAEKRSTYLKDWVGPPFTLKQLPST